MILKLFFLIFLVTMVQGFQIEEECLNYTVYPVQYELTIMPYIYAKHYFYYDCEVVITVIANGPNVQTIEIDAVDLDIQGDSIKVLYGGTDMVNKFRPFEYNKQAGKLYIFLRESMKQYSVYKAQYQIKILFRKIVKSDTSGIFVVPYEDGGTKYIFVTRLSPNKAKHFFPCFDNPRFEAVFKFRVHEIPTSLGVQYTNTSLVIAKEQRRNKIRDGYIVKEYIPSPQVALHQVGFHNSQFGSRQVSAKNTNDTIIVWAPSHKLMYYDYILRFSEGMMNMIHEYASVNRPLVYGPINIVSVPSTLLDGYEIGSWNLLTNGETRLVYAPQFTSVHQEEKMTFELAQQLCRIWLGNPGELERTRWTEEWFKEGVATYLASYFLTQFRHGVLTLRKRVPISTYGLEMKHKAMAEDWHHSTPALMTFNRTLAIEIPKRYKELVQMKTASILWMVENWIGSDKFHMALVKYINTRRGQYVSLKDFMTNLDLDTVECLNQFFNGSTASKVLNSWFHQHGYPVITVNVLRDRNPNAIQLKQHKFSFKRENRESNYLIPISYFVQNNQNCFNCYQPRFTIDHTYTFEENLNDGWILLNTNASGYYRVNYDSYTWKLIAKTLKEDKFAIPELNRAQIVNDVFALYASGQLDQVSAVEILDYLETETSPIVWDAAISGFELIKTQGASCNLTKYLYKDWQEFMKSKVSVIYTKLVNEIEQQQVNRKFRSNIISFACAMEHEPCLDHLRRSYNEYMHGRQRLDPDTREACYRVLYHSEANFGGQGFNAFEVEDKNNAVITIRKMKQFIYGIPAGNPIMDRLIMSTTPATSIVSEYNLETQTLKPNEPQKHSGGAAKTLLSSQISVFAAVLITVITYFTV